jgi:hypothetical protein
MTNGRRAPVFQLCSLYHIGAAFKRKPRPGKAHLLLPARFSPSRRRLKPFGDPQLQQRCLVTAGLAVERLRLEGAPPFSRAGEGPGMRVAAVAIGRSNR